MTQLKTMAASQAKEGATGDAWDKTIFAGKQLCGGYTERQ
jgi:hypothetical protein